MAKEHQRKTTRISEQWQSDASYFFVVGWGWLCVFQVLNNPAGGREKAVYRFSGLCFGLLYHGGQYQSYIAIRMILRTRHLCQRSIL